MENTVTPVNDSNGVPTLSQASQIFIFCHDKDTNDKILFRTEAS